MTLTDRELEVVAAWWQTGSVKAAAAYLAISEQTAKNTLYLARIRGQAPTNASLVQRYMKLLPVVKPRRRSHKQTVGNQP